MSGNGNNKAWNRQISKVTVAASGNTLLSAALVVAGETPIDPDFYQFNTEFTIQALGAGTLSIKPIVDGKTTHVAYTVTNDTILLDTANVTDFDLTETTTTDAVDVIVTAFRFTE